MFYETHIDPNYLTLMIIIIDNNAKIFLYFVSDIIEFIL